MRRSTMRVIDGVLIGTIGVGGLASFVAGVGAQTPGPHPDLQQFFSTAAGDDDVAEAALDAVADAWRDGYAGMVWDMLRFMRPPLPAWPVQAPRARDPNDPFGNLDATPVELEHPTTRVFRRLIRLLEEQTGERFGNNIDRWHQWIWEQPYDPHPEYGFFKGVWYAQIDPLFREFFPPNVTSLIRLDEVDWGGVPPNGIPPLEYPDHVAAEDAEYLDDGDIVFGIAVNGDARAYPKRILAWHEMALDPVGGLELTIVYCTLCGTVIPYESIVDGQHIRFGTSGRCIGRTRSCSTTGPRVCGTRSKECRSSAALSAAGCS